MRAKFVNEKFTEDSDPIKDLNIGYGKKPLTKSWKILDFIKSKGEEGASLKEIQYFIWTKLDGKTPESFYRRSRDYTDWETGNPRKGQRKTRGHWNTQLLGGMHYHEGLLHKYCEKNPVTKKWVIKRMPKPGENFYDWKKY